MKWIKENWISIILWTIIIVTIIGFTILTFIGCEQGWWDCTPTNVTIANINLVICN